MSSHTKRRAVWSIVAVLLTLPPNLAAWDYLRHGEANSLALDWVEALTATELADAADNIADYPRTYRTAILGRLSPEARNDIWRKHLLVYMEQHPELTGDERLAIQSVLDLHTPALFSFPTDERLLTELRQVGEAATKVFGVPRTKEIFFGLGPEVNLFHSALPLRLRLADFFDRQIAAYAFDDCDCYHDTAFNYCSFGMYCSELQGCVFQEWGCGFSQTWPCDGLCVLQPY